MIAPEKCDMCSSSIADKFYDAKTIHGPWANMCPQCFKRFSLNKLGTGFGQEYTRQENGVFKKTQG